jgi:hypothetical protein
MPTLTTDQCVQLARSLAALPRDHANRLPFLLGLTLGAIRRDLAPIVEAFDARQKTIIDDLIATHDADLVERLDDRVQFRGAALEDFRRAIIEILTITHTLPDRPLRPDWVEAWSCAPDLADLLGLHYLPGQDAPMPEGKTTRRCKKPK